MMGDLTDSENRLIAALDRIDYTIERAAERLRLAETAGASAPEPAGIAPAEADLDLLPQLDQLRTENAHLTEALAAATARLELLNERLTQQGHEAARLVSTNEALSNANRNLLSRADSGGANPDEARLALEAELEALRQARAAEIAQFSEVLDTLDAILAESGRPANGRAKRALGATEERG